MMTLFYVLKCSSELEFIVVLLQLIMKKQVSDHRLTILKEFSCHLEISNMANIRESKGDAMKIFVDDDFFAIYQNVSSKYFMKP